MYQHAHAVSNEDKDHWRIYASQNMIITMTS